MKKFVKRFIGEFLLILGVGLFVYNVFSFDVGGGTYHPGSGDSQSNIADYFGYHSYENTSYYYYQKETLNIITIGAVLITIGILVIRNKKEI